jgi:alkylresorcinol/alkylpyrone synthase
MPSVVGIGTAVPEHLYSASDVLEVGAEWLSAQPDNLTLFRKFVTSSKTSQRNFIFPRDEILSIGGMEYRATVFESLAAPLGATALSYALKDADIDPRFLKTLIFTSCTCPSIPAVDGLIIDQLGLARTINRIPIYQHGCAGGVVGLRLASELSKTQGLVAVTSVELCSLVFQKDNVTAAQLVGAAIFADGAASALISPEEKGLVLRASQSFLIPNSRHLMGYNLLDDGSHLRLDRNLPQELLGVAPERIEEFLRALGLTTKDISYWLFHPGGTKILDFLETHLQLEQRQAHWARDVLTNTGNLSSATVLFVLKAFLDSKVVRPGEKVVMLGVGPGLTLELILFEWVQ